MDELQVLIEQLSELLSDTIEDSDDALELCQLAGMVARLDASASILKRANEWRDGIGADRIEDGWCYFDSVEMTDTLALLVQGELDAHAAEELVFDVDEWVAAAVWCGEQDVVKGLTEALASAIRTTPTVFQSLANTGAQMASSRAVAEALEVYDFWLALADIPATE